MRWTLTLPIDLPSKNGVPRNRHAYKRQRDRYAATVRAVAIAAGMPLAIREPHEKGKGPPSNVPRRAVTITRLWGAGQRAYDAGDGLEGGAVMLRDAMQATRYRWRKTVAWPVGLVPGAGIVWDDSPKWSMWSYSQRKAEDGKARVVVEVRDIETTELPATPGEEQGQ